VAVDAAGNVYVADTGNNTIRKITPEAAVTTLAGRAGQQGSMDGRGSAAQFLAPTGVAVDSAGIAYVADYGNNTIRKITPDGVVSTLAGRAGSSGSTDGIGSAARFYSPYRVAVDSAGNVYVVERDNSTIRKITPVGEVRTLAGSAGQFGGADGIGSSAQFYTPRGVALDSAGNLFVADTGNNRITKGTPIALPPLQFLTSTGSLTISNGFFQMGLTGPSGSNVVVEASANFQAWTPLQTNALPPTGLDLSLPLDAKQNQFFRARLAP
jgi:streptogramin lyase